MEKLGRYQLEERIGSGGMAEAFRATYEPSPGIKKTLVVKRILPHYTNDDRFIRMFRDEAAIMVSLTHGNIVQVFDFGEEDGTWFLAMEYVEGCTLRQFLKWVHGQKERVPVAIAAHIGVEVARGLTYIHTATDADNRPLAIVHRDLNPPNILLGVRGEVKVTDFGVAKARYRTAETTQGKVKGKIAFTAPEVIRGDQAGQAADIWSLGVVLYMMLTAEHPFDKGANYLETVEAIKSKPYPPITQHRTAVPQIFVRTIDRMLDKDPNRRPTADEVHALLSQVAEAGTDRLLKSVLAEVLQVSDTIESRSPQPAETNTRETRTTAPHALQADISTDEGPALVSAMPPVTAPNGAVPGARRPILWGAAAILVAALIGLVGIVANVLDNPTRRAQATPAATATPSATVEWSTPAPTPAETAAATAAATPAIARVSPKVRRQRAHILYAKARRQGHSADSIQKLRQAVVLDPVLGDAWCILAIWDSKGGDRQHAEDKCLKLTPPTLAEHQLVKRIAAPRFEAANKVRARDIYKRWTKHGASVHAIDKLKEATTLDPQYGEAYCVIAIYHYYLYDKVDFGASNKCLRLVPTGNANRDLVASLLDSKLK